MQLARGELPDGTRLYSEARANEMWRPNIIISNSAGPTETLPGRAIASTYATGWQVQDYRGERMITHGGGAPGYVSGTVLIPGRNTGFSYFTNAEESFLTRALRSGITDIVIMRVADTFLAFPSVLMALVLAVAVGPSFGVVVLVLGLVLWARFARLVRSEVLSWKHRDFIALARIAGAGHTYIILRHILPNLANTMMVLCTLQVGWAIVVEASLTFLGAGVPPPTPTWGGMIAEGLDSLERAWWLTVVPGVVVAVVVFAFNLVGDWVRDLLDPGLANV